MINMTDKKALITGSNGEIGIAVIENLLSKGIEVYGLDKDETTYPLDNFIQTKLGEGQLPTFDIHNLKVDYIIHIAGGVSPEELAATEIIEDQQVITNTIQNNFLSAIDVVLATKNKINANGSITFISSINAYVDYGLPIYSASKAALEGLMNGLIPELTQDFVRVNVATLGSIQSNSTEERYKNDPQRLADLTLDIPKGIKPHTPETAATEIIEVALSNQTGQVFLLDKGQMEYKRNNRNVKTHVRF